MDAEMTRTCILSPDNQIYWNTSTSTPSLMKVSHDEAWSMGGRDVIEKLKMIQSS